MARIRSVHPTLFTDEAWVSCTPMARVLYIGLLTDADDQGLFEWKPLQIRMRLLPGDNADIPALLAELLEANLVAQIDSAGKKLGAVRNFRRFQRPKKPNAIFVLPAEWRTYVGLSDDGSELEGDEGEPVPPKSELGAQMEDGGWRREEITVAIAPSVAGGDGEIGFEALWKAYPHVKGRSSKPKSKTVWDHLAPEGRRAIPAAASRFKAEGVAPPSGHCALEKWLEDQRWIDWLGDDEPPAAPIWRGPDDVRAAFRAKLGKGWCASYLDKCGWQDVPDRVLIPATQWAADKIRHDASDILAKLNLTVLEKAVA